MSESSAGKWFAQAVEAHLAPLYRYGLHLCRGRVEDAEDLIQDAVLRALRNIGQIRDRGAAKAWLFRIVTTTHLNRVPAERHIEPGGTDQTGGIGSDFWSGRRSAGLRDHRGRATGRPKAVAVNGPR